MKTVCSYGLTGLIAVFISFGLLAQAPVDSLRAQLNSAASDSAYIYVRRDLVLALAADSPDVAERYAEEAIARAREINDLMAEERSMRALGLVYEYKADLTRALEIYNQCISMARKTGDMEAIGNALNTSGIACYFLGDHDRALEYYDRAVRHCDSVGYFAGQAYALNNMAIIFRINNNHSLAAQTYRRSIKIKEAMGDSSGMAASFRNLGFVLTMIDSLEASEAAFLRALELYEAVGDTSEIPGVKVSMASAYSTLGRYEDAIALFSEIIDQMENGYPIEYVQALASYAEVLNKSGRYNDALEMLSRGYDRIAETDRKEDLRNFEHQLAIAYDGLGDPAAAGVHWKTYAQLQDTLNSAESKRLIEEFQVRFDTEQKEARIAMQDLEISQQQQTKIILIIGVALAVVLLLITLYSARSALRTNRVLREQKLVIEQALADKEVLLREIHHRVKNNLQVISSLLSLQSRSMADGAALEAVKESQNRVHSMALIHQSLYSRDDLRSIDASAYISELCESIMKSYNIAPERIGLELHIDDLKLDVDTTIPLGLILNELITNAIKYAFPDDRSGQVRISLGKEDDDMLLLEVADNGVGVPEGILQRLKEQRSFGLRMIDTFARKLKANWDVKNDNGTIVSFRFKAPRIVAL